jgi:threonine synthase
MQRKLAAEGIWVEPASASGMAGLVKEIQAGRLVVHGKRVVGICTGHGLKDPDIISKSMPAPKLLPPNLDALTRVILGEK